MKRPRRDATLTRPMESGWHTPWLLGESSDRWEAAADCSIHVVPTSASSSTSPKLISVSGVFALAFSPLSKTLFSYERPVKISETETHRNVKAWDVATGDAVGGWHHKTHDDWVPIITATESHLLRHSGMNLEIFAPPLLQRPAVRIKGELPIKGIFLSSPTELPQGTTSTKPVPPHPEPGVAIWLGEHKGAPASVRIYPLSQLTGKGEVDPEKTEHRDFPTTTARKAFYKADKLNVKWNNAGTMVRQPPHIVQG